MTDQTRQRAWTASCNFCGAPVEFQSAASPLAVCTFCRSTLVRDGESIKRIGQSAELFHDHSPLGLGVRGRYQGESFTLVGRLQLTYLDGDGDAGRWTEWHALFDNGKSGCVSEDNGAYVFSFALTEVEEGLLDLNKVSLGGSINLAQRSWVLSSRVQAKVYAAQGELSRVPDFSGSFPIVELRNPAGEVLSIEPQAIPVRLDLGRRVELPDLSLSGLPNGGLANTSTVQGKAIECPKCGAGLVPRLSNTQTIVCDTCRSVVDIRSGLGSDLKYYKQSNSLQPLIALGSIATLKVAGHYDNWQVVGYQERCNVQTEADSEQFFWREYLLYNQQRGFAFLVDSDDGWSIVCAVTGVPSTKFTHLDFDGVRYHKRDTYTGKTTYVLGEFYWPVKKGQRTLNTDYAGLGSLSGKRLNREQSGNEIVWSAGEAIDASEVLRAFRIPAQQVKAFQRDVTPLSTTTDWNRVVLLVFVGVVLLMFVLQSCTDDCSDVRDRYGEFSNEYKQCKDYSRSSSGGHGGSYGGYNSGGSHK